MTREEAALKLGIHAYAWCSEWSNDTLDLIDRTKSLGLDFIEIPLMVLDRFDARAVKRRLEEVGLLACTSTALLDGYDVTSDDPDVRRRGVEYLKACVRATHDIGASLFTGVTYSQHVKPARKRPDERTWELAAACLREVAVYARSLGVNLGLEPVNRYESYLLNTAEQALRLIDMIGEPNVVIHLDTYHMNIEEKDFYQPARLAGDRLMHLHLCENDRGIPGTGHVDWDGLFRALGEIRYEGFAALESFVDVTDNMHTWTWRKLAPSGDELIREGSRFLREKMRQYGLGGEAA